MSHCFLRWAWDMHTMILSKGVQYTMPAEKVEVRRLPQQILCTFSYHRHVYVERSKLELKNLGEHSLGAICCGHLRIFLTWKECVCMSIVDGSVKRALGILSALMIVCRTPKDMRV